MIRNISIRVLIALALILSTLADWCEAMALRLSQPYCVCGKMAVDPVYIGDCIETGVPIVSCRSHTEHAEV